MNYDLWIDYHREDAEGLTHASVKDLSPGVELVPGSYVVVGNEEADPAVAKVVTVEHDGVVLVRVLPGPAEEHLHLTGRPDLHRAG